MHVDSFRDMYVAELQELHDAGQQLCTELPRLAASAKNDELKHAFSAVLADCRKQCERLGTAIGSHGANPNDHTDQSMQALLRETEKWKDSLNGSSLADAGLVGSVQKLMHYEIAGYGTAAAYAGSLGFQDDERFLHEILEEKKSTDRILTALAESAVNRHAALI